MIANVTASNAPIPQYASSPGSNAPIATSPAASDSYSLGSQPDSGFVTNANAQATPPAPSSSIALQLWLGAGGVLALGGIGTAAYLLLRKDKKPGSAPSAEPGNASPSGSAQVAPTVRNAEADDASTVAQPRNSVAASQSSIPASAVMPETAAAKNSPAPTAQAPASPVAEASAPPIVKPAEDTKGKSPALSAPFIGPVEETRQLEALAKLDPQQLTTFIAEAVRQPKLGSGNDASAFPLPSHDRLVLRYPRRSTCASGLGDEAAESSVPPNFKMIPVRDEGGLGAIAHRSDLGIPRAIIVPSDHAFAERSSVTSAEAMRGDQAPLSILRKSSGGHGDERYRDILYQLHSGITADPQHQAVGGRFAEEAAMEAFENAHNDVLFTKIKEIYARLALGTTPAALEGLNTQEREIFNEYRRLVGLSDSRIDREQLYENNRDQCFRKPEEPSRLLRAYQKGAIAKVPNPDVQILTQNEHAENQRKVAQAFNEYVGKQIEAMAEIADMPQKTFNDAVSLINVVKKTGITLDMQHQGNMAIDTHAKRIAFYDLDYNPSTSHIAGVDLLFSNLLARHQYGAHWVSIVHPEDIAKARPHLQQLMDKLSTAAAANSVSWNPRETHPEVIERFKLNVPLR